MSCVSTPLHRGGGMALILPSVSSAPATYALVTRC